MSGTQMLLTIAISAGVTILTRAIPFLLFPDGRQPPAFITWLGRLLPRAVMAMLVVYCLKDVSFTASPFGIPALAGVVVTAVLHVWKRQMIFSICGGTVTYMLLLRLMGTA